MNVEPGSVKRNGNGAIVGKGGKLGRGKKANGRKDAENVPAVQKPKVVADKIDYLVQLHRRAKTAGDEAAEAVTKVAEESGYLAATVKKLVTAKAGDKFEEKHREVAQQAELFDEVAG